MTTAEINDLLWHSISPIGVYWWMLTIGMAVYLILQMYRLNAAKTLTGRIARVFGHLGCLMICASPWISVAGILAFPVVMFSFAVLLTQQANKCSAERARQKMLDKAIRPHHYAAAKPTLLVRLSMAAVETRKAA